MDAANPTAPRRKAGGSEDQPTANHGAGFWHQNLEAALHRALRCVRKAAEGSIELFQTPGAAHFQTSAGSVTRSSGPDLAGGPQRGTTPPHRVVILPDEADLTRVVRWLADQRAAEGSDSPDGSGRQSAARIDGELGETLWMITRSASRLDRLAPLHEDEFPICDPASAVRALHLSTDLVLLGQRRFRRRNAEFVLHQFERRTSTSA